MAYFMYSSHILTAFPIITTLRAIAIEDNNEWKQRSKIQTEAKNIMINNFTRSNREKSDTAIAILGKLTF